MKLLRLLTIAGLLLAAILLEAQTATRPGFLGFGYTVHKTKPTDAKGWLYVRGIVPDGPAARAGLAPQDLITAIDGRPITFRSDADVILLLARIQGGQRVVLRTMRNHATRNVAVTASPMTAEIYERWLYNFELAKEKARKAR